MRSGFPARLKQRAAFDVRGFATKMDALLALLDSTADGLAAEWDLRSEGTAVGFNGDDGGFEPTIQ